MDFLREARWPPSSHNRRYHERETAVAMDLFIYSYIYVYVDNYQNKIYLKNNEICICRELTSIYGKSQNLQLASIYGYRLKFTPSRSEAESKRNACNNITNSL